MEKNDTLRFDTRIYPTISKMQKRGSTLRMIGIPEPFRDKIEQIDRFCTLFRQSNDTK